MEPQDLTATIVHLLGIGHHATFPDATGRPMHVTTGEPIAAVLGERPATDERTRPTGNIALVPGFTKDLLLNRNFEDDVPLTAVGGGKRLKGWQATPLAESAKGLDFGVRIVGTSGQRHAAIGYGLIGPCDVGTISASATAMLTQEVRNPRAGAYTISIRVRGGGAKDDYREFREQFRCRLVLFGYQNLTKDPLQGRREFASIPFDAPFGDQFETVTLTRKLRSQDDGASEIEMGVGVAILLERRSAGNLAIPAGRRAFLLIDDVAIDFVPRARNDDVKV
jgi:hypothetical protein